MGHMLSTRYSLLPIRYFAISYSRLTNRRLAIVVGIAALLVPAVLAVVLFPTAMIDTRELFAWGRFFPLVTHKHPPLMAWAGGIVEYFLPANAFTAILAGQVLNAIGVVYLYATLRLFADRDRALFFAFLFGTSLYFQLAPLSYALNADILQVPIWLALVFHFLRAAETGAWRHWLAVGIYAAAAVLTKYTAGLLFAAGAIAALVTPEYRPVWRNLRLYAAVVVSLVLVSPHLIALHANDTAIRYAEQFTATAAPFADRFTHLWLFLGGTLLFLAPGWVTVAGGLITGNLRFVPAATDARGDAVRRFLLALTAALFVLCLVLIFGFGTLFNHRYGAPLFGFFVAAMASTVGFRPATQSFTERTAIWTAAAVAALVVAVALVTYGIFTSHNYMQEPTVEAAATMRAEWAQLYSCGPGYILGDRPSAHGIAIVGSRQGIGVPVEDIGRAPWFDRALLARDGAIVAYRSPLPAADIEAALPGTVITDEHTLTLPLLRTLDGETITYHYFFIPPRSCAIASSG